MEPQASGDVRQTLSVSSSKSNLNSSCNFPIPLLALGPDEDDLLAVLLNLITVQLRLTLLCRLFSHYFRIKISRSGTLEPGAGSILPVKSQFDKTMMKSSLLENDS